MARYSCSAFANFPLCRYLLASCRLAKMRSSWLDDDDALSFAFSRTLQSLLCSFFQWLIWHFFEQYLVKPQASHFPSLSRAKTFLQPSQVSEFNFTFFILSGLTKNVLCFVCPGNIKVTLYRPVASSMVPTTVAARSFKWGAISSPCNWMQSPIANFSSLVVSFGTATFVVSSIAFLAFWAYLYVFQRL